MKKWHFVLVGLLLAVALGWAVPAAGDGMAQPGTLVKVDLKAAVHPKAYHPKMGDLVECFLEYVVVPNQMVDDLKVRVESGRSVGLVAVVHVQKLPGAGQISLFLAPRDCGLTNIRVTPVIGKIDGKPVKLAFLVGPCVLGKAKAEEEKPK